MSVNREERIDALSASLSTVLVQYERAMIQLGWTMTNVRPKVALDELSGIARERGAALRRLEPYARRAEMRWMSVEDATIEIPARLVAELCRTLHTDTT